MNDNWKPGDIAIADGPGYKGLIFRYFRDESKSDEWKTPLSGDYYGREVDIRRLVVIDPEDREQVERLAALLWPHYASREMAHLRKSEITADALRQFASPPPPPIGEPTALGAVVEDARGRKWVRITANGTKDCWKPNDSRGLRAYWADVEAVRILAEGVTP